MFKILSISVGNEEDIHSVSRDSELNWIQNVDEMMYIYLYHRFFGVHESRCCQICPHRPLASPSSQKTQSPSPASWPQKSATLQNPLIYSLPFTSTKPISK